MNVGSGCIVNARMDEILFIPDVKCSVLGVASLVLSEAMSRDGDPVRWRGPFLCPGKFPVWRGRLDRDALEGLALLLRFDFIFVERIQEMYRMGWSGASITVMSDPGSGTRKKC